MQLGDRPFLRKITGRLLDFLEEMSGVVGLPFRLPVQNHRASAEKTHRLAKRDVDIDRKRFFRAVESMELLIDKLSKTRSNSEFLAAMSG